ncbi:NAD-dependent malic enzyme [Streptomyces badius]
MAAQDAAVESLRDREIGVEQEHLDRVYHRLEEKIHEAEFLMNDAVKRGQVGTPGALAERDAQVFRAGIHLNRLNSEFEDFLFGRIDLLLGKDGERGPDGAYTSVEPADDSVRDDATADIAETLHIGRIGVLDSDYAPLVIDWRAPAAAPFYRSTPKDPGRVVRRRVIRSKGRKVLGVEDDLMRPELTAFLDGEKLPVIGDGALMAALGQARSHTMRDIVSSIQAEQDLVIRAPAASVTEVTGGPGTGKTAVALHRAAYLLYQDRRRYAGGILIVSPTPLLVAYTEGVLPSLGEEGQVAIRAIGSLSDDAAGLEGATAYDEPAVARVKGSSRMLHVLRKAARGALEIPAKDSAMATAPSVSYSMTVRLEVPASGTAVSQLTTAVESSGGSVTGLDVTASGHEKLRIDVTIAATSTSHADEIVEGLRDIEGVVLGKVSDRTFLMHLGGKIEMASKHPIRNRDDLSMIYTPGVARVCMAIAENPEDARRLTIKRNSVAVVTDGSAVLGLGNIGPKAALPVMEGKAALFKRFAGIDAWPICLDTQDTDAIVEIVKAIAPGFAGINLEDISAPRCFEIEARLREALDIPVFHDDQHGTAIVVLAALTNALRVVGKNIGDVRVVMSGAGAAGTAILKLLIAAGVKHAVVADIHGVVHAGREDLVAADPDSPLRWIADNTNPEGVTGTLRQAVVGADVFIGVSAPNVLNGDDVAAMADDAIVFALANPDPEVDPAIARQTAAVVATGRSDFPNQINNVLVFPGVFRGLLDAQSRTVNTEMMLAAAGALADVVAEDEVNANYIIPSVFNDKVAGAVAGAVRAAAKAAGVTAGAPSPAV